MFKTLHKKLTLTLLLSFFCVATHTLHAREFLQDSSTDNPRFLMRGNIPWLKLIDLRSQVKGGMLVTQAEVINTSNRDMTAYWRVRWLDNSGFQLGDGEVWKQTMILGKQTQLLRSSAVNPKAVDFKIEFSLDENE